MFKKFEVPNDYLVMIRTTRKDRFNRIWDASGSTPAEVIDSFLDLTEDEDLIAELVSSEISWVETRMPEFRGYSNDNFGSARNWDSDEPEDEVQDREYRARYFLVGLACTLLSNLERSGRYAGLWDYEHTALVPEEDLDITVNHVHEKASQFQLVIDGSPQLWKKFQKTAVRNSAAAKRRQERDGRRWEREHSKAVKKGLVTNDPALKPEVDMLNPHGDGTLQEGDVLFDALMSGETVSGNRTPTGWKLDKTPNNE